MSEQRLQLAINQAVRQRNYRRARDRALVRLANLYPDLYKDLLKEEKENDKALGKEWVDLNGRANNRSSFYSDPSSQRKDSHQENKPIRSGSESDSR